MKINFDVLKFNSGPFRDDQSGNWQRHRSRGGNKSSHAASSGGNAWEGCVSKEGGAFLMDSFTQKACHTQPELRQSAKRIGDECMVERCVSLFFCRNSKIICII